MSISWSRPAEPAGPAARRLKVDHTTVSRRIAELEKSLSVKLFDRKPDGFVLTEHGHRLFAIAERIEQEAFSVPQTLGSDTTTATGRVRVATMEGIGAFFLAERFAELAERNAGILVELVTERHLISLTKREADIFLSSVYHSGHELPLKKVGSFRLALYASSLYLSRRGMPASKAGSGGTHLYRLRRGSRCDPARSLAPGCAGTAQRRIPSPACTRNRMRSPPGAGIGLLPLFSAKANPALIPILGDDVKVYRDVFMSVHQDIEFMARVRLVSRYIASLFERDHDYLNEL